MKNQILLIIILFTSFIAKNLSAQTEFTYTNYRTSGCTKEAVEELIKAVNKYRADTKNWNSQITQYEFTLGGTSPEQQGIIQLPVNQDLMLSAKNTSERFANGTYPVWDHFVNGEGPTMRAIKDGWTPSMNKLFYANEEPVFTMLAENLFEGSLGYKWQDVLEAWKNSPGHNTTLLSRGAVSIGCGCADTKKGNDEETYWVLLVEMENSFTETEEITDKYFKQGEFYKVKPEMKKADLSKYKAFEVYDFIPEGLNRIRK